MDASSANPNDQMPFMNLAHLRRSEEWQQCQESGMFTQTKTWKADEAGQAQERARAAAAKEKSQARPHPLSVQPSARDPYLSETLNIEIVDDE